MTCKELPIDNSNFCDRENSLQIYQTSVLNRQAHSAGKNMPCQQYKRNKSNHQIICGWMFVSWLFCHSAAPLFIMVFSFLLNCFDTLSTLYVTEDWCPGSSCGRTHSFLFTSDFWHYSKRTASTSECDQVLLGLTDHPTAPWHLFCGECKLVLHTYLLTTELKQNKKMKTGKAVRSPPGGERCEGLLRPCSVVRMFCCSYIVLLFPN